MECATGKITYMRRNGIAAYISVALCLIGGVGAGSASYPAVAQQQPVAKSVTASAILQAKTPVMEISKYDDGKFVDFAMAYANAKISLLKDSDPAAAKEWHDFFLTSVNSGTVPPGVSAFAHKLKALGEASKTNPNIVLPNITGEQVLDVVYENYHDHLKQAASHS